MKLMHNKFLASAFLLVIILVGLNTFRIISINITAVFGLACTVYSVYSVYEAMGNKKRSKIIVSTFVFFLGALILLSRWFEILNPEKIIFPSLVFIIGMVLLLLFMENTNEKYFLFIGIALIILAIFFILLHNELQFLYYAEFLSGVIFSYWPIIVIAGIIIYIVSRNKS